MGFGDLNTQQGVSSLNEHLASRSYIEGFQPSQADTVVFNAITKAPATSHPHALRWYNHIKSYGDDRKAFSGTPKDISAYGSASQAAPKQEANDDDDIDLFGSDEEDPEAEKIKEQRLKDYAERKAKKPGVIAKSSVILDVKPWDDETDMALMEQNVRTIACEGLLWGASKLVPVGYGIKKLQIICTVEDDKVSIEWLQEEIEKFEDVVQSVDIAAFNKL